jgi:RNA polymerase sigma-70 factor, Bacteroides expansion family 1
MTKTLTKENIIPALQNGDIQAFTYIFDQYYSALRYFAQCMTNDQQESQDIVLRVFNVFWNMRDRFNTLINIKAFLYITTRNNCIDFLKYRKRQEEVKKDYQAYLLSAPPEETERLIMKADLLRMVYAEIQNLPDRCRKIFELTYLEGLQANEIAEQLQITVSTVTSQRARAIQLLRTALKDANPLLLLLICRQLENHIPS